MNVSITTAVCIQHALVVRNVGWEVLGPPSSATYNFVIMKQLQPSEFWNWNFVAFAFMQSLKVCYTGVQLATHPWFFPWDAVKYLHSYCQRHELFKSRVVAL